MVSKDRETQIARRMTRLGIRESELEEKFIRGSGHGGQKINKTSSCVYLKHLPTGIEIKCQSERSQAQNRWIARRDLCERIEKRRREAALRKQQALEKRRRASRKRSRAQKERMLRDKRIHGEKKKLRGRVRGEG